MVIKSCRLAVSLLLSLSLLPSAVSAFTTYDGSDGMANDLFIPHCISCHSTTLSGAARGGAPVGINYNTYSAAISGTNETRAVDEINAGTMPPGGGLSSSLRALATDWENDGFRQRSIPTMFTSTTTNITNTSARFNGSGDPNGSSTSADFQYGVSPSVTTFNTSNVSLGSSGDDDNVSFNRTVTGLSCGTTYRVRSRGVNGVGTGVDATPTSFTTSACSNPIIRFTNNLIAGSSTTVNMSEDGDPTPFSLTLRATDADGGTLTWSIINQADNGAASFGGSATANTLSGQNRSISYTPDMNFNGTDFFVIRVRDNTNRTDQITVNVNISATADAPQIRLPNNSDAGAARTLNGVEDAPTMDITLRAFDEDGGTLTWSIPTPPGSGVASFGGAATATNQSNENRVINYVPNANVNGAPADSFFVQLEDADGNFDQILITVVIAPVNDPPTANDDVFDVPVNGPQTTLDVIANDTDIDGAADVSGLTVSAVGAPSQAGASAVTNADDTMILYTPPPDFVANVTFTYTLSDPSGATDSATVTITPPDADADRVPDVLDNCPNDANNNQANNDGDAQGDVCDDDDDNDGIPDTAEELYPGCLDPFVDDAAGDCDGDGRTNGQEIADGFVPTLSDVAPADLVGDLAVDATGFLTVVDLGNGVPTPRVDVDRDNPCETGEVISTVHGFRPGRNLVFWTAENSDGSICSADIQTVDVRPLVNLNVDQSVEEGATAVVRATLTGDPPDLTSPVILDYTVSGTADGNDHDAVSGQLQITADSVDLNIVIAADAVAEGPETVIIELTGADQAALGIRSTHTLTIVEDNVPPSVAIGVLQGANTGPFVLQGGGQVDVAAQVTDPNAGDTFTYDWSGTDDALGATGLTSELLSFDPLGVMPGVYRVEVTVTDSGGATGGQTLFVTLFDTVLLSTEDTDGDGVGDDVEGFQDTDFDGVPEHLDDANLPAYLLQTQTGDQSSTMTLETEAGLDMRVGEIGRQAQRFGAWVDLDDVEQFAGGAGGIVSNADPGDLEILGSLVDFEVAGLNPGDAVRVVIPLQAGLLANAEYRKFTSAGGWVAFQEDANNAVSSTASVGGLCPGPGDPRYVPGLAPFDDCLELLIEDGGPNDADGVADGTVRDPGGVLATGLEAEAAPELAHSSRLQLLWLGLLVMVLGFRLLGRRARMG